MSSYRSIVIFLLIVLIVAAFWGAIRYFNSQRRNNIEPLTPPLAGLVKTINITSEGFNPAKFTIEKGMVVEFVNRDTSPHWPASDVHPLHTLCPDFDALRGLKQGETYRHAFSKSQTCSFHDHFNPSFTGIIIIK